jgi:hypothetical protein
MRPYQKITPEISMENSRYSNAKLTNQAYFPPPNARYVNQDLGNIISFQTERELEEYLNREQKAIMVYLYSENNIAQTNIITDIFEPLLNGTVNKVVLISKTKFPCFSSKYISPFRRDENGPILLRVFRGNVLRYFNQAFTFKKVCQFANSTAQWRNKGFFY